MGDKTQAFDIFQTPLSSHYPLPLKVTKCEIFDRSDFHDFYTLKPFWVGDYMGLQHKLFTLILGGARHHLIYDVHAPKESILPAYVAWWAGTIILFLLDS
jgi:hypothetical protein